MKKASLIIISVLICSFGFVSSSISADVAKIGIINFQKILDQSSAGKMIQKRIGEQNKEIRTKLIDEKNTIDKMTKDFKREALVLSPEKQDEKARDIRIRKNDALKMEKQLTQKFKKLQADLLGMFQKDITKIVEEIGKKEGYLIILEKKQSAVVYSPDNIDITDTVIEKYNKQTAALKKE